MISILIILISTIVSLFFYFDPVGLIKGFKYLLYATAIFTLLNNPKYLELNIINQILKYGLLCVLFSLGFYLINFLIMDIGWDYYVSYSTWNSNYMPTGMSNLAFDISNFSFIRTGGNHGIYGSYLVVILILAVNNFFKTKYKNSKILIVLALINMSFITSREAILLLFLTIFFYVLHHFLTRNWINRKAVLFSGIGIIIFFLVFIIWSPEIVILHKIKYMIKSISDTGGMGRSVNFRFNTWYLFFTFLAANPWNIFTGVGFNRTRFGEILENQEVIIGEELFHVDLPESIYVATLGYGGIFSLLFLLFFFISLFYLLFNSGKMGKIFSFFLLGLMITNATGASLFAELLISQFGVICAVLIYKGKELDAENF
tara:strand:+ start:6803 stop:7921 length:1119 start_codon:yes stop_codon:yes gene_type:complete